MSRVYVTDNGCYNNKGRFRMYRVIGVDSQLRYAVSYVIRQGCYRHHYLYDDDKLVLYYKSACCSKGYRISCVDLC